MPIVIELKNTPPTRKRQNKAGKEKQKRKKKSKGLRPFDPPSLGKSKPKDKKSPIPPKKKMGGKDAAPKTKPSKPFKIEDIPGTPHFKMVPQFLEVANGGSVKKFPDLSGDGKVTQKDILMGRGVIKKRKGGKVTGRSIGPAGASIVSDDGKKIKQIKKIGKSVGIPGAAAGLASGIQKTIRKVAGRLAKRGYGKARK